MTTSNESTETDNPHEKSRSKVANLIHTYDLTEVGDELVSYWTRESDDRMSLRELAEYFNKELLARKLQENATTVLDGEVENYYRLLTSEDVSSGARIQAENRLERRGVEVDRLRSDFVSRQAIHTYLTGERAVSFDQSDHTDEDRTEARIDAIGRLKARLVAVAERTISELVPAVRGEEPEVVVLVTVHCPQCNDQYPITEFLSNGGCGCSSPNDQ